jgi:hypothetical protein
MKNLDIIYKNDKIVSFMIGNDRVNYTVIPSRDFSVYYFHPFESTISTDEKISICEINHVKDKQDKHVHVYKDCNENFLKVIVYNTSC